MGEGFAFGTGSNRPLVTLISHSVRFRAMILGMSEDNTQSNGPLAGLNVLEVGDWGEVAGKLLGDAGAEVIRVEVPKLGSASRSHGPFVGDEPGVNRSLAFAARNTSKRSVTLNIDSTRGQQIFSDLASRADIVIDSAGPDILNNRNCGHDKLLQENPKLIWCSITAFGLTGPRKDWPWNDLVSMALGGPMMSTGYDDHDLPPIRPDGLHSMNISNEYAITAVLAALWLGTSSEDSVGHLLDVSAHECISATTEGSFPNWAYLGQLVQRQTGRHASVQRVPAWQHLTTDDQYVLLMGGGVPRDSKVFANLLNWMDEHDASGDMHDPIYQEVLFKDPRLDPGARNRIVETITDFVKSLTAEEVYRGGQGIHMPWGTVRSPEDNLSDPHWDEREFWWESELPEYDGKVRFPGAPYRFSASKVKMSRRPPLLGEHNSEVYSELGFSKNDLVQLARDDII